MAAPYSTTSVSNYNVNPPPDDGSTSPSNKITWANTKTKIGDPLKTAFDTSETNTAAAFGKMPGGAVELSTAVDYQVLVTDQGKLIKVTVAGKNVTTPDALTVGYPFVFTVANKAASDITVTGSDPSVQQTIDGATAVTIPAGCGATFETDGTNWFTWGLNFVRTQVVPQGYLTPVSATPVITSDVNSATAVYYTPDVGNLVLVSDGTKLTSETFSEMTLTLSSNHVANSIYDVFYFNDSGTRRLGTGPAWNTITAGSCARGTGAGTTELQRLAGLWTNKNSMTARNGASTYTVAANMGLYLGSIYIDATAGQVSCHVAYGQNRKRGIWNAFNRKPIILKAGDSTASWTYTTATWRASNGAPATWASNSFNYGSGTACNGIVVFQGLAEEHITTSFIQRCGNSSATVYFSYGIGVNSATSTSGLVLYNHIDTNGSGTDNSVPPVSYISVPLLGINTISSLEYSVASGTSTWQGTEAKMQLTASWRG